MNTQNDAGHASESENLSRNRSRRGWWWLGILFGIAAIAVVSVTVYATPFRSTRELGPVLTHRIIRSDLIVSVIEQGTIESQENTEIKCGVRGENTVIWVVENGTQVQPGDELVRLDTLAIEDQINERSKYALWSLSGYEQANANARRSKIAIQEYLEGRFVTQLKTLEKDLAIAESNLRTAQNMLGHAERMFERGYVSELDIEEKTFSVTQAKLSVDFTNTQIDVLKRFTKQEELERLNGNLKAAEANMESLKERAKMDGIRRDLALAELELCVIEAPKAGLVIFPSAQAWENTPDIEEGATVHRDQVLLLMPDLDNMQVKVGIHESMVERVEAGMKAKVTLPEAKLLGEVSSVAEVARPAGWWTGNVVKYDTIIGLDGGDGLRPGMSAEVEVIMAEHLDVITVPVAAVLETTDQDLCWVSTEAGIEKRVLKLGDSNDVFIVVESGLAEGDEVVLNPRASVEEARIESLKTIEKSPEKKSEATTPKASQEKADSKKGKSSKSASTESKKAIASNVDAKETQAVAKSAPNPPLVEE